MVRKPCQLGGLNVNEQALRAEIERLGPWHHDVELAPGITTSARDTSDPDQKFTEHYSPSEMMEYLIGNLYPDGLQGRSFLDCACNSGGHSLAAARLGAGRIFAFDARQHWVDQADFLARQGDVANLTTRRCTLGELPELGLEPFDVTLFAGIFYHLPDPVAGLRIAADLTREILIVNTATRAHRVPGLVLNSESPTHVLSGVDRLAWLPTGPSVMREILAWCGFEHSRIDLYWASGPRGWKRLQMVAARDPGALADYDRARPNARSVPSFRRRLAQYLWARTRR
jgi:tRNA (mo5U34)-methyltransferase